MTLGDYTYWSVPASGYGFENEQSSWNLSNTLSAVMDTGTSFIVVPADILKEIVSYLNNKYGLNLVQS